MAPAADRRRQILDAALEVFLEKGYAGAGIADIRARSGASTGSIYHLFPGKAAIAAALFEQAVAGWAAATRDAQDGAGEGAEAGIRASVEGLVDWGLANPGPFRILDELRFATPLIAASPELAAALQAGQAAARELYEAQAARGEVRDLPWPVARALILGPAYDYLRRATAGQGEAGAGARAMLSDAAWAAVAP